MLKTSIGLKHFEDRGLFRLQFRLMREAGFDTFDLDLAEQPIRDLFYDPDTLERYVGETREMLEGEHMELYQAHAPFHPYVYGDPEKTERNLRDIRLSIPVAGKLGVKYLIVHPIFALMRDRLYRHNDVLTKKNIEMYRGLQELANKNGVALCTENIFSTDRHGRPCRGFSSCAEDLLPVLDAVPGLYMCLDAGHAALVGEDCVQMIRAFGGRLRTLHLHGNDGRTDLHVSPFEFAPIDWDAFGKALREVGYEGSINLESGRFYRYMPEALMPDAFRYLHSCAAYIAGLAGPR